jgi:hypothetical protein
MGDWIDEYEYDGWENPQLHAAMQRLGRQRAKRRATKCTDMPQSQKRRELLDAGFTHAEVVKILAEGTAETSQ